jgi:hypothetical protein
VLQAKAEYDGETYPLSVRVASYNGSFFYDLTNPKWECIQITKQGWQVIDDTPVPLFTRFNQTAQVQPSRYYEPDIFDRFMGLTNVRKEDDRKPLKVYIVSLFIPDIQHVILQTCGEKGGAKSMLEVLVKELVDPAKPKLLSVHKDRMEFIQQVAQNYLAFYDNSNSYDKLGEYIVEARKDGRISRDAIADETRHSIADFTDIYVSPESRIRHLIWGDLDKVDEKYVSEILYKWSKQPKYVEVWLEKTALVDTFRNFLRDRHVRVVPNRGYSSWAFAYDNFKRLERRSQEFHYELIGEDEQMPTFSRQAIDKEIHILYFGDYDPSGSDMDRFLKSEVADYFIKYFGLEGKVKFDPRIAVTLDQIKSFNLPPEPEESDTQTLDKLQRDPRYENFLEVHNGQLYAAELDALMAYVPDEFEGIVKGAVDHYYDPKIWKKLLEEKEHSSDAIRLLEANIISQWLYDRGYPLPRPKPRSKTKHQNNWGANANL